MKKTIISLVLLLIATCSWAQKVWKNPSQYCQNNYMLYLTVEEIEFKQEETIVHMRVDNMSGSMICFPDYTVLKDQDGKKYALKSGEPTRSGEEACNIGKWISIPTSGYGVYSLHFEPLPETTNRIQFIESYDPNGFLVWNITDSKSKPKVKESLFDSNWQNAQTGDWILGLYANNAVYDSKVWSYEEKSDKKVILTNGQQKLTITIGKEKNGTRQFAIDGKKLTLSKFDSSLPTYPTADDTPFNTELKKGEATITGIIKDFPREIADKKTTLRFISRNIVTDRRQDTDIQIDSTGVFTVKVPVYGTSQVLMEPMVNNLTVSSSSLVVEPGKTYFMVQDWSRNTSLFMGENARLMNELYAFNAYVPFTFTSQDRRNNDAIIAFKNKCIKNLDLANEKLADIIAKNPTLSKRYRDFIKEFNHKATAEYIILSWYGAPNYTLPSEVVEAANKTAEINPSLPLSLTQHLSSYLRFKEAYETQQIRQKYSTSPELYFSFEKKGLIKLSDEDRALLTKWQDRNKEENEVGKLPTREERRAAMEKISEKYGPYDTIILFTEREDMKAAENQWAPSDVKKVERISDSLYTDNNIRNLSKARGLSTILTREKKPLEDEGLALLAKIDNNNFKALVTELQEASKKEMAEKVKRANAVIHPASDVEGLTDGKAIMDKLVAPYKGKIVYVDLWGVGCGGCMISLQHHSPVLKAVVKDFDIVYLYIATEKNEEPWKFYISEFNLTGKNEVHYNLPRDQFYAIGRYIKSEGIPTYLLYDKHGNMEKIPNAHVSDPQGFRKKIEELSKK